MIFFRNYVVYFVVHVQQNVCRMIINIARCLRCRKTQYNYCS